MEHMSGFESERSTPRYLQAVCRSAAVCLTVGALTVGSVAQADIITPVDIAIDTCAGTPGATFCTLASPGAMTVPAAAGALNPTDMVLMEDPEPLVLNTLFSNDPGLGDPVIISAAGGRTLEFDFIFSTDTLTGTGEVEEDYDLFYNVFNADPMGLGPIDSLADGFLANSTGMGHIVIDLGTTDMLAAHSLGLEFVLTAVAEDAIPMDEIKTTAVIANLVMVDPDTVMVPVPVPGTVALILAGLVPVMVARRRRERHAQQAKSARYGSTCGRFKRALRLAERANSYGQLAAVDPSGRHGGCAT